MLSLGIRFPTIDLSYLIEKFRVNGTHNPRGSGESLNSEMTFLSVLGLYII